MNSKQKAFANTSEGLLNDIVIDAIQDIKGKNIIKLDLRNLSETPTSFFIICEGDSVTQVKAIADNISKRVREDINVRPSHTEGYSGARWVLVDYFDTVVHVFHPDSRKYYELEELWSDAEFTEYQNL